MLEDKVIYITGGSSGIGLSIAEHCLKNNAQVVITGRNEERLDKAKKTLSEFSPDVITECFDISDPDGLKREVCATVKQGGRLPADWYGACWPFIFAKKKFLIYGRIPDEELWRANLVYAGLCMGMGYIIWEKGQGRKWVGLGMLTLFPVISLILLTGANFDISFNL